MRRRIATIVLLVGALLIGHRYFGLFSSGPVPVELHYRLGDPPIAHHLEVDSPEHHFETDLVRPDTIEKTRMKAGSHQLTITLDGARSTTRTIEASKDAVVTIDLTKGAP